MGVLFYLDISTAHIREETMEMLVVTGISRMKGWPAMTIATYEYGAFITVPYVAEPEQWAALPDDLLKLFDYARDRKITLICLDSSADEEDDLPTYEWKP